jgi:hypothetical protein
MAAQLAASQEGLSFVSKLVSKETSVRGGGKSCWFLCLAYSSILKIEATYASETSAKFQRITLRYIAGRKYVLLVTNTTS